MLYLTTIFFVGASIGSFVPAQIYRIQNKIPLTTSRSICENCKEPLSVTALIPVFSYFLLKGKASCCNYKIPIKYPAIEFLSGILLVALSVLANKIWAFGL